MKMKNISFKLTLLCILLSLLSCQKDTEEPPTTGAWLPGVFVTLKPGICAQSAFELINLMKGDFWYGRMTGFLSSELPSENVETIKTVLTSELKASVESIAYDLQLKLIIINNVTFEEIQKQSTQTAWQEIVKEYKLKEQPNKSWRLKIYTTNNSKDEFWMKKFKEFNFVQDSYRLGGV
jgi:hypothetical protein